MKYSKPISVIIMILGLAIIALGFISPITDPQITLLIAGVALFSPGYILFAQAQDKKEDEKRDEEKHQQIMEKLEKIEQDLEKLEQPKGSGVAVADILGAGLKYYAEHINKAKEDEPK